MSRVSTVLRTLASTGCGRRAAARLGLVAAALAPLSGCTSGLPGQGSSYAIIDNIQCANGAEPQELGGVCDSDVVTLVEQTIDGKQVKVPTIFADPGEVTMRLAMKDPTIDPGPSNFITFTRYRVEYVRADGRNVPGVDVPYPFDGAMTMTVRDVVVTGTFNIVRIQAKMESPLRPMASFANSSFAISTLAKLTFYGKDQAGRDVSVEGQVGINFANWGDPD